MAQSFLKLDTRRALKDGSYPVVIGVGHGTNMYLTTGITSHKEDWMQGLENPYTGKNAKAVNSALKAQLSNIVTRILELKERGIFGHIDNKALKAMLADVTLTEPPAAKRADTLAALFDMVAATKSAKTAEIYRSTLVRLRKFCDPDRVTFSDINRLWLDGFVASMRDLRGSTQSIHLRNLRAVNNYAIDCDLTTNYPFRRYRLPTGTTRKRSLSAEIIRNIYDLPAESLGYAAKYRDIFILTFLLVGINYADLCALTKIEDGRVNYIRAKTHKPYSIKVEPEALAIIDRLKGTEHLLYIMDGHTNYRNRYNLLWSGLPIVRQVYNEAYPEAPIAELTTYWARHSWATIAASLDIPKDTIAEALGHDMGNPTTAIYIDFDRSKVDAANRRVIDWVLYGKKE